MSATVQSVATTAFASGSSITVTKPTGLAVGDLMIFHYVINDATDKINTLSGWTHEVNNQNCGGNTYTGLQWKIADSGDTAASNFTFAADGTSIIGGAILRIDGHQVSNLLNDAGNLQSNDDTPTYTNTVTPSTTDHLLLFFIGVNTPGGGAATSTYAIVTDNPTWTERYDFISGTTCMIACATAARSSSNATGNSSAAFSAATGSEDSYGMMVAIGSTSNASVSPSVVTITSSVQAPTVTGSASVSPSVVSATLSVQTPTITTPEEEWTNKTKNSSSWTNKSKS